MRFLIIDDSKTDAARCKAAILSLGSHDCAHVKDPRESIRTVKSLKPDVIILDIIMDHKNGFEVLRELRHGGFNKPIIMYSSKNQHSDAEYSLNQGASAYISKPITVKTLSEALSTAVDSEALSTAVDNEVHLCTGD